MEYFLKKYRHLKSKIVHKFHRLLFLFYFFSIFGTLFAISRTQNYPKIMEFFVVFYWKGLICEIFVFQISAVYYLFFLLFY